MYFFFSPQIRLIINDNLDTGTQLPFIEMARQKGYAIIVTNTNDNYRIIDRKKKLIQVNDLIHIKPSALNNSGTPLY